MLLLDILFVDWIVKKEKSTGTLRSDLYSFVANGPYRVLTYSERLFDGIIMIIFYVGT